MNYEIYLDETGGNDGAFPVLGVCGYLISSDAVQSFESLWDAAIGELPYIHMKDFAPGGGIYKHMGSSERDMIARKLISIIKEHVEIAIGAFAPLDRFEGVPEEDPYSFCLENAARHCFFLLDQKLGDDFSVSLFYEKGRKYSYKAVEHFEKLNDSRIIKCDAVEKEGCGLVQAADMVTWLVAKYIKDAASQRRKPRKDFLSLMDVPCAFDHIFPFDDGICMIPFHNDSVLSDQSIEKIKMLYDNSFSMSDLFGKFGAVKVGPNNHGAP